MKVKFVLWQKGKLLFSFCMDIFKNQHLLYSLAKNDIQVRYMGSYLGFTWAFIQPLATICIMWFVFTVGFKTPPIDNFPFILWLVAGMVPWFFIADAVGSAVTSVVENSFLVKKIVFRISLLPLIKILSALFIHSFFIVFLLFMFAIYGYYPNWYTLQIFYYLFAAVCLSTGISFITSAIVIFVRDFGQVVNMILQFAFWGTPIFWSLTAVPAKYHFLFYLNPAHYIVNGYRESVIYHVGFWQHPAATLYFWLVTLFVFLLGAWIFRKLKPHFADVL